jgi:hypothetical protein
VQCHGRATSAASRPAVDAAVGTRYSAE